MNYLINKIHPALSAAVLVALMFVVTHAIADGSIWHNKHVHGEGMFLVEKGDVQTFALFTYTDKHFSILPHPSPPLKPLNLCNNCLIWYLGADGILYLSEALEYPYVTDGTLSKEYQVGTYILEPDGDGWSLNIVCNALMPDGMRVCGDPFGFDEKIFGD